MNVLKFNIDTYDVSRPLLVYGYGMGALSYLPKLIGKGIDVPAIFDRDERYHHTFYPAPDRPIEVLPPESIDAFDKSVLVLNTSSKVKNWSVFEFLEAHGREDVFYEGGGIVWNYYKWLRDNTPNFRKITMACADEIESARKLMADAVSRGVFDARLDAYLTGDWATLWRFVSGPQYFEVFRFGSKEVLADAGALDGGTAVAFARVCGKTGYEYIYAFEPSPLTFLLLQRRLESDVPNSSAHCLAITDYDGYVSFVVNHARPEMAHTLHARSSEFTPSQKVPASTLDAPFGDKPGVSSVQVPASTLDTFFADKPATPTFIKLNACSHDAGRNCVLRAVGGKTNDPSTH